MQPITLSIIARLARHNHRHWPHACQRHDQASIDLEPHDSLDVLVRLGRLVHTQPLDEHILLLEEVARVARRAAVRLPRRPAPCDALLSAAG